MSGPDPRALGQAFDGARLAGMLPYIEAELTKMEEAAIVRVDQMLVNDHLTPDLAQLAWVELISYRRLRRRLEQKVRIGISAAERSAPYLEEPPLP